MITIVFDESNLQSDAVLYCNLTDVVFEGKSIWRTSATGTSLLSRFSGVDSKITCRPVDAVGKGGGHVETINGLDELSVLNLALKAALGKKRNSEIFKGSALGGHFPSTYSYIAMLLKEGMKDRFGNNSDVHSGVIMGWKKANLVDYIKRVRDAQTVPQ